MKTPQSPAPVAGEEAARPASEQPVEAIGAGPEVAQRLREAAEQQRDCSVCDGDGEVQRHDPPYGLRKCGGCDGTGKRHVLPSQLRQDILAALSPASPAQVESAGRVAVPLEATSEMMDAFYHAEGPAGPDRVVSWSVATAMARGNVFRYLDDIFANAYRAMLAAVPASPAPTPMGREVEALREALEDAISLLWDHVPGIEPRIVRLEEALAASSPSPAQGGIDADLCMSDERAKETAKPMHVDDATGWVIRVANGNVRFWSRDRVLVERKASEWGLEASPEPLGQRPFVPPAGEVEDALSEVNSRIPDTILHGNSYGHQGFYPHAAIKTLVAALYAAAPTDEVGKS